ncbi:DUF262 domain-containing protein [Natroniella acetigena]|uniref:HNH endonuclease family protein n=1 Tax=Natroniella acetigena TaxID=52004 RepID=UPI00200B6B62|nr:DUF262 domain-containing protein [Natroniella acetigena]MCK8827652.1 DUF262 domain-containing protein [Natroniella acetigena]
MPFNPDSKYDVFQKSIAIEDFHKYSEEYVIRPPYQRKNVWSKKKKKSLLDSLFRRYYIPNIIIREVRLGENETVSEIIDGQQRITTIQDFFSDKIRLPSSLKDLNSKLSKKYYSELSAKFRRFIDKELMFKADIVKGIEDPTNPEHQEIATEIFWRLQQGESLNYMEKAHARLSSISRNFIVKFSDDITFDYQEYKPVDENENKHKFFNIIDRKNDRMQHLMLMTRFLLIEDADGATDLNNKAVEEFIDEYRREDGVGDDSFEETKLAKNVISNLNTFYDIFKDDPILDEENGLKEFKREYMIISFYLLLRHLKKHYVFEDKEKEIFKEFLNYFYNRWSKKNDDDSNILNFISNRQQSSNNVQIRHRILRLIFFNYLEENNHEILPKDSKRQFNEAERIKIYRRDNGFCQKCLEEGVAEKEAKVSWSDYEADHVLPHSKGGKTEVFNGQVLCKHHNRTKSNKLEKSITNN